jgi:hypothetical protein
MTYDTRTKVEQSIEVMDLIETLREKDREFLVSIKGQMDKGRDLSRSQLNWLDDIWKKVCESPH